MNTHNPSAFAIRPATPDDAADLANLVVIAGEGLPLVAWETMREKGETAMDVGRRRAAGLSGAFTHSHADVAVIDGAVVAAIVAYPLPPDKEPQSLDAVPPIFRPLEALENAAIPSWYVNVLATYTDHRRHGLGTALLAHVEARAQAQGYDRLSLITGDINPALDYYQRLGFAEAGRADIVKDGWVYDGDQWVLLTRPIR